MFCPALSPVFLIFYIIAGIADMADGAVARKTGTVSEFGSKLDVCLIKLLPVLHVPVWLCNLIEVGTPV